MKLPLLFAIFVCLLSPALSACSPSLCRFGIFVENIDCKILRFFDTQADAEIGRSNLLDHLFIGRTAKDACGQNACGANSTCQIVTSTIFECNCKESFEATGSNLTYTCSETDECIDGTHNCSANANCTNITPGFNCTCQDGYTGNGTTCLDIDECASEPCHVNATCTTPELNSYNCTCVNGYSGDGTYCEEINECTAGTDSCHANATCESTDGNFNCTCIDGFTGDGVNCEKINDCTAGTENCHANATCQNKGGSFNCTCIDGFTGDGVNCENINDCGTPSPCHADATCNDLVNNYTCVCNDGWTGDGVNECIRTGPATNVTFYITLNNYTYDSDLQNTSSRPYEKVTALIAPAFSAFVKAVDGQADVDQIHYSFYGSSDGLGYAESRVTLTISNTNTTEDVFLRSVNTINQTTLNLTASADECSLGIDNCSYDRICVDTPYQFCCYHDLDYTGQFTTNRTYLAGFNDSTSIEFNALASQTTEFAKIVLNGLQKRACTLEQSNQMTVMLRGPVIHVLSLLLQNATFSLQDVTNELAKAIGETTIFGTVIAAGDFDECIEAYAELRNCSFLAECKNFAGSFSCACNAPYHDNGTKPGQICDIDECASGPCHVNATCTTPELDMFSCTCVSGYTGNGTFCEEIDACTSGPCHVKATCTTPNIHSHNCTCLSGYTGNGTFCEEIDECNEGRDNCHANAICENTDGSFKCICNSGFTGDGVNCEKSNTNWARSFSQSNFLIFPILLLNIDISILTY